MKRIITLVMTMTVLLSFGALESIAQAADATGITVHYKGDYATPYIYYWNSTPSGTVSSAWPGEAMVKDLDSDWYTKAFPGVTSINLIFNNHGSPQTSDLSRTTGEWWFFENRWYASIDDIGKTPADTSSKSMAVHVYAPDAVPQIQYGTSSASSTKTDMIKEPNDWYRYGWDDYAALKAKFTIGSNTSSEFDLVPGDWFYKDGRLTNFMPIVDEHNRSDFREETIYFVMTARFNDGVTGNNVHCWDDTQAQNPESDPAWRGDFQGLIDKLDYIKALGFSAVWITPVVENASGYDYHGYHAIDFSQVDPRLETPGATYQDLINAAHAKGMKIIQDVVFNHSGNFGEENLFPMFKKDHSKADTVANLIKTDPYGVLPENYATLNGTSQYGARINAMKEDVNDTRFIYHHGKDMGYEQYIEQTGQIAGDCVDLNTENPYVTRYLIDAYSRYIDMGVDAFRVDTAKHISRLVFDKEFNPAFMNRGGENFFMFGEVCTRVREVWNHGQPADSAPFYTWKEQQDYPWGTMAERAASTEDNWYDNLNVGTQPTSSNHYLNGNNYRTVDYSKKSDLNVIDFPMHWNFKNAYDAFNVAKGGDHYYADATWNVTYVDSHDYAPDGAPEGQRFNQGQDVWAENLSLMFTFRGIPSIYYGSEIEFQKGAPIDVGPNAPLSTTGRAYYGDHLAGTVTATSFGQYENATGEVASTLNHPLAKHIRSLNLIRRAIPALQKGQYSTDNVSGGMAYKRRFTDATTDSFALVSVSGGATFSNIPNGTYVDAVTGNSQNVTNGTLYTGSIGKGNVRVFVLNTALTSAPGKVAVSGGTYIN